MNLKIRFDEIRVNIQTKGGFVYMRDWKKTYDRGDAIKRGKLRYTKKIVEN